MLKFLVHVTCGPGDATRATLSFLVAKTAAEEGHSVSFFLAGDAVTLLKDENLKSVAGLGTGKLEDHFKALTEKGARFYLSGMSAKARGMSELRSGSRVTLQRRVLDCINRSYRSRSS